MLVLVLKTRTLVLVQVLAPGPGAGAGRAALRMLRGLSIALTFSDSRCFFIFSIICFALPPSFMASSAALSACRAENRTQQNKTVKQARPKNDKKEPRLLPRAWGRSYTPLLKRRDKESPGRSLRR